MDVETVAAALEREHREIDEGVEAFAVGLDGDHPDPASLAPAVAALRRHIYLEEVFLFPPLQAAGVIAPVLVMLREHGRMWETLDKLDVELANGFVATSVAVLLSDLQDQLQAHNLKEEHILYPLADQALSDTARAGLRDLLDAGRLPEGWVCQAARP